MTDTELELPKGWEKTNLETISLIKNGFAFKSSQYVKSGVPLVRISNIQDNQIDFKKKIVYLTKNNLDTHSDFLISKGDILMALSGATTGKFGVFNRDGYALLNQRVGLVRTRNNEFIIQKLLHFFFGSLQNLILRKAFGMAQPNISTNFLKSLNFNLPPLNEQKRIVSKIEELFSKIDSAKQSLENIKLQLEQYRQSLLKSAFEGKLTEAWRTETKFIPDIEWVDYEKQKTTIMKIYNENLKDIVTITNDWYWLNIKSLSESMRNGIYKEKKFYTDDGIACLRMYNIENWELIWKKIKRLELTSDEISEYEMKPDDILFNRVNSMELVGKAALIPKNIEQCVYESKNIRLRFKTKYVKPKFVHMWLIFASRHYFNKNFQQTTGMASVNQGQLGDLPIPYCSLEEQEQIVSQIEHGFSLIENTFQIVESTLQNLQTMKMSILKQAFEGKLVPQDPDDEPASVLLERIRKEKA